MLITTQWRQYANLGSSGVGASGSMRRSVKVEDASVEVEVEEEDSMGENVILGSLATSLTRTKQPFEGFLEGKVMNSE